MLLVASFVMWTLTNIGMMFDNHPMGWISEIARIFMCLVVFRQTLNKLWLNFLVPTPVATIFYWTSLALSVIGLITHLKFKAI